MSYKQGMAETEGKDLGQFVAERFGQVKDLVAVSLTPEISYTSLDYIFHFFEKVDADLQQKGYVQCPNGSGQCTLEVLAEKVNNIVFQPTKRIILIVNPDRTKNEFRLYTKDVVSGVKYFPKPVDAGILNATKGAKPSPRRKR